MGKRKDAPECKFLPTPVRKLLTEDPVIATAFVGDTSHIQKFVDQVNCTNKCSSPGCTGQLTIAHKKAQGLGGTVEVAYKCSGCVTHSLTFNTSVVGEVSQQPQLSVALQVAFVCAGCTYAHYDKILEKALGMCTVDEKIFTKPWRSCTHTVRPSWMACAKRSKKKLRPWIPVSLGDGSVQ